MGKAVLPPAVLRSQADAAVTCAAARVLIVAPMPGTMRRCCAHRRSLSADPRGLHHRLVRCPDGSLTEGRFDLDDYVDYISRCCTACGNVHVVAVCQPSVPVVAAVSVMEANAIPSFGLDDADGGPIDTRRNPTAVNNLAAERGIDWFRAHVITKVPFPHPGVMRNVYPGFLQLSGFISMNFDRHKDAHKRLFSNLVKGDGDLVDKHRDFYDEYLAVMDLTAEYYLQTVDTVFVKHSLPKGEMTHRGKLVDPSKISRVALMRWKARKTISPVLGKPKRRTQYAARFPTIVACIMCKRVLDTTESSTVPDSNRNRATHLRFLRCGEYEAFGTRSGGISVDKTESMFEIETSMLNRWGR